MKFKHPIIFAVFTAVCCFLMAQKSFAFQECVCNVGADRIEKSNLIPFDKIQISDNDEIQYNKNLGKLIAIGDFILLKKVQDIDRSNKSIYIYDYCPEGFIPLSKEDMKTILNRSDVDELFGSQYLDLEKDEKTYIFTMTSPTENNEINNQDDEMITQLYALHFNPSSKKYEVVIQEFNLYDLKIKLKFICKLGLGPYYFLMHTKGYAGYDLEEGQLIKMSIENSNVVKYSILANEKTFENKEFEYKHLPTNKKCGHVSIQIQLFNGVIQKSCFTFWTLPISKNGYRSESNLDESLIKTIPLTKLIENTQQHQINTTAPIAPIHGKNSSFLILYSDMKEKKLYVQKVTNAGEKEGKKIQIKQSGNPFDIIATTFGFFVLVGNPETNNLEVASYSFDGKEIWKRTIITASNEKSQDITELSMKFYNKDCSFQHGFEQNSKPISGKLNYAKGRLQVIFVLKTQQMIEESGILEEYLEDIIVDLDAGTGFDQEIINREATPNSFTQQIFYNGLELIVVSFRQESKPVQTKTISRINFKVEYKIIFSREKQFAFGLNKWNGNGLVSKQAGGFFGIVDGELKIFSIQIINQQIMIEEQIYMENFLENEQGQLINNVKVIPYGKNFLLRYSLEMTTQQSGQSDNKSYLALLNSTYAVSQGPIEVNFSISAYDDWQILENGAIVFSQVNQKGQVFLLFLPNLIAVSSPRQVTASDKINDQSIMYHLSILLDRSDSQKCLQKAYPNLDFKLPHLNQIPDTNPNQKPNPDLTPTQTELISDMNKNQKPNPDPTPTQTELISDMNKNQKPNPDPTPTQAEFIFLWVSLIVIGILVLFLLIWMLKRQFARKQLKK